MPRRRGFWGNLNRAVSQIPGVGELTGADQREAEYRASQRDRDARREEDEQRRIREENIARWEGLGGYSDSAYRDQLAALNRIPEEGFVEGPGRAEAAGAAGDPRAIEAQMRALAGLEDVYGQGGLTAIDRARIAEAQAGQRTYEQGQRGAIMQGAQERGMGAGGAGYAAALTGQQQGANRLSQQGLGIEGMAQERALSAMEAAGSLGGQARGQSFEEDFSRRQAADIGNRYNTDYARGYSERAAGRGERKGYAQSDLAGDYYGRRERMVAGETGQGDQAAEDSRRREDRQRAEAERFRNESESADEYLQRQGRTLASVA